MRSGRLLLGVFMLAVFSNAAFAGSIKYSRYTNVRFAYGISYPDGLLIPQGEADNGDGQAFMSFDNQVRMLAYGSNNALDYTLHGVFKEDSRSHTKEQPNREVAYKLKKRNWYVVSGTDRDMIFYKKVIYDAADDQFITFEITYPISQRAVYDPITTHIAKSMKLLSGPFPEKK